MYTRENLHQKNLKELKEIGFELNILPDCDRRCRQNWIDALAGKNPPLLQLLESSTAVEDSSAVEVPPIEIDSEAALTEEETAAAAAVIEIAKADKLNLDLIKYILQDYLIDDVAFCKTAGLNTRTVAARVHAINTTAKKQDGQTLKDRLMRILQVKTVSYGGIEKIAPVEVEPVQEAIEVQRQEPPIESKFGRIVYPKPTAGSIAQTTKTTPGGADGNTAETDGSTAKTDRPTDLRADAHHPSSNSAKSHGGCSGIESTSTACEYKESDRVLAAAGNSEGDKGRALLDRPDELTAFNIEEFRETHATEIDSYMENFIEGDKPPNRGEGKGGRLEIEPKLSQSAIVPAAKTSPGVSRTTSTAHQLLELFKSQACIVENSPGVSRKTEPKLSQSAIVPEAKNHLDQEEGITLSSTFLARYSPPQPEIIHFQSDADGQLSLLDFTVETDDEPPDPDDFESLDAFREAIALWDAEHPEPLEISLDSFCEWAPCPDDWYEPEPEVMEHSSAPESCKCWNFSIPTFDRWCDHTNRQTDTDEPPDTGNFARLPGPKPPKFPPSAIGQSHTKRKSNADQTHLSHISITSQSHNRHIVAAGSSSRLGRSPPGGDVM